MTLSRSSCWRSLSALVAVACAPFIMGASSDATRPTTRDAEVRRIHAHFDSVLAELPSRSVVTRSPSQRQLRVALFKTLRVYNERARFPKNYEFTNPTPYFVDQKTGVLCAVAYLLESTGRRDIVDRVAAANNNVWVMQLASDTAFTGWLDSHGITIEEAARIQVPYMGDNPGPSPIVSTQTAAVAYNTTVPVLTLASLGASVWNVWTNADGHRKSGRVIGVTAGLLSMAAGAGIAAQMNSGDPYVVPGVMAGVGMVSTGLAVRAWRKHSSMKFASREALKSSSTRTTSNDADNESRAGGQSSPEQFATISPILPLGRNNNGTGMAVSIRF